MNVASYERSKKLFEVSDWGKTNFLYFKSPMRATEWSIISSDSYWEAVRSHSANELETVLAYDLGFLIRKLPSSYAIWRGRSSKWYIAPVKSATQLGLELDIDADTPEDAACKLAIELFKQNIITRETNL